MEKGKFQTKKNLSGITLKAALLLTTVYSSIFILTGCTDAIEANNNRGYMNVEKGGKIVRQEYKISDFDVLMIHDPINNEDCWVESWKLDACENKVFVTYAFVGGKEETFEIVGRIDPETNRVLPVPNFYLSYPDEITYKNSNNGTVEFVGVDNSGNNSATYVYNANDLELNNGFAISNGNFGVVAKWKFNEDYNGVVVTTKDGKEFSIPITQTTDKDGKIHLTVDGKQCFYANGTTMSTFKSVSAFVAGISTVLLSLFGLKKACDKLPDCKLPSIDKVRAAVLNQGNEENEKGK